MTDNMTQGTVLERFLYHCKTWNNHKNNIMKREKEFKEYLKNKLIDFAPCGDRENVPDNRIITNILKDKRLWKKI